MVVVESRKQRRVVGRLDRGADLLPALRDICRDRQVRAGEIRAMGTLEEIEVSVYDPRERRYSAPRRFRGALEVISFVGNASEKNGELFLQAQASVSRHRDNGVEVIGGHLVGARVLVFEFVVEAWDDLLLRRSVDPATGLHLWGEAFEEKGAEPEVSTAQTLSPMGASKLTPTPRVTTTTFGDKPLTPPPSNGGRARDPTSGRELTTPPPTKPSIGTSEVLGFPEAGDLLDHPTFGRSTVERVEENGEFAVVRLRSGRLIRLSLEVLDLRFVEQGVFEARIRR